MAKLRVLCISIILLMIAGLALAACQPTPTPTATKAPATATVPAKPTATPIATNSLGVDEDDLDGVTIEVWHTWFGVPASLFDLQVTEFNEENPWGITVHATSQGSYNMLFNQVMDALDAPQRPDVVVALSEQISVWGEAESLTDLMPYIEDPKWGFAKAELSDFPYVFLEQDQRENRQLAANQFMRSDESADNDGKGGWIVDSDSMTVLSWMLAFDGGPLTDGGYKFITPENIETLKRLKKLFDDGCAWVSTEDTPYEQFAARSALFITASLEEFSDLSRSFAQLGNWLFVRWMLAPENQARWVKSTGLFPLRVSSLDELSDYQDEHPQWAAGVELITQAQIQPQLLSWRKVRPVLGDGFDHIFRVNMQAGSVAAVLAQMSQVADALSD
ncbi:MAG: hypothetical protein B6I38_09340 [Anaerolineaceae bacterium 4572_5.1]|nr:MAG: hypothetical protein B6I38_09340 [Anaerolineaceae bacterium 4572_5.1]